jgi:hypothetical protein
MQNVLPIRLAKYEHSPVPVLQIQDEDGNWAIVPIVSISHETLDIDPVIGGPEKRISRDRLRELKAIASDKESETEKELKKNR